jgi:hypothetical protein
MIIIINNITSKNRIIKFDRFHLNLKKTLDDQYITCFILAIIYAIATSLILAKAIFICFIKSI